MLISIKKIVTYLFTFILLCSFLKSSLHSNLTTVNNHSDIITLQKTTPTHTQSLITFPKRTTKSILSEKHSPKENNDDNDISFDDMFNFFDDITLDDLKQFENNNSLTRSLGTGPDPEIIIGVLGEALNNQPIWKKTQTPNARDILYHIPHKMTAIEYGGFSFIPFFNMTNKMDVSAESLIDLSAITLEARDFIISFLLSDNNNSNVSVTEAASLIPLFQKMQIQERKVGLLFQGGFVKGQFTLQAQTSLQVGARNFWLSLKDQKAINEVLVKLFGELPENTDEFLIIKYGMGDTKIKLGLNTLNHPKIQADFGFEGILPTSSISSSSDFENEGLTNFDLDDLLSGSGLDLFRGVRDALLEPQLGNGGFWGFGPYFESKIGIFRNLAHLWVRLSYHKYLEGTTHKLVMFKPTRPSTEYTDPADLSKLAREYLFPTLFKVKRCPGGIFNAIISTTITTDHWLVAFGYDFYAQNQEKIKGVLLTPFKSSELLLDTAESGKRIQHKVFSEVTYRTRWKKTALDLGIGGDITVASINLGYDWTIYAKAALSF